MNGCNPTRLQKLQTRIYSCCTVSILYNNVIMNDMEITFNTWFQKYFPNLNSTCNIKRIFGHVIFYPVRVISRKSLWVCLCIPLSLLGKKSVKTFPRQRRINGGVVIYAVRVVPKESRRLVLPRAFCFFPHFG
jgi:hypothetical protein